LLQLQIEGAAGADANQELLVVNPALGLEPGPHVVALSNMECNGIILVRMGSIAGLATHLNLLIIFNR
jgi:hypothetical protein